jgi:Domain of unknown function (DUF1918)
MAARAGNRIVVESERVGQLEREGEILEVMQSDLTVRYRVRWNDGRETILSPAGGSVRVLSGSPTRTPSTSKGSSKAPSSAKKSGGSASTSAKKSATGKSGSAGKSSATGKSGSAGKAKGKKSKKGGKG